MSKDSLSFISFINHHFRSGSNVIRFTLNYSSICDLTFLVQTITYTLARADVQVGNEEDKEPEKEPRRSRPGREDDDADSQTIRAQNQVALILICEFSNIDEKSSQDVFDEEGILRAKRRPPPIIIATTHLKVRATLVIINWDHFTLHFYQIRNFL